MLRRATFSDRDLAVTSARFECMLTPKLPNQLRLSTRWLTQLDLMWYLTVASSPPDQRQAGNYLRMS